MPTRPINNSRQLNRRFNRLADHLATAKDLTDATWDKFAAKFHEKLQAIQEFVSKQENNDKLMERIELFQNSFNEIKERIRPFINEPLARWTEKRVAEIGADHAKWDAHAHVDARTARMAQIEEENAALAKQPIQSRHQLTKAMRELSNAQQQLNNSSVAGKERMTARKKVKGIQRNIDQFLDNSEHRANTNDQKLHSERQPMRQREQATDEIKTKLGKHFDEQMMKRHEQEANATKDFKTELEIQIDMRIVLLQDALLKLQKTPALSDMGKHMAQKIATFQLSVRDPKALETLKTELKGLMNKEPKVRDKLIHRIWHHIVTTIKAFLHCLDKLQAKMTGHMIDKQGREHFFKTPKLPVKDALDKFDKALEKVTEDIAEIHKSQRMVP